MKLEAKTEAEMRESKVPTLDTIEQLNEYIQSCLDAIQWPKKDDGNLEHATEESGGAYGRCVYAMSLASVATFNYMARQVGASGFQASCADLDIFKRLRHIEGPFGMYKISDLLYPQYDLVATLKGFINNEDTQKWLKEEAKKLLAEKQEYAAPSVITHWKKIAGEE